VLAACEVPAVSKVVLTTVFVRPGHYALESAGTAIDSTPDLSIERIGEPIDFDLSHFLRELTVDGLVLR
jgi:hypothetical protein